MTPPRFDLYTPSYRLRTSGVSRRLEVEEWSGSEVALAARTLLEQPPVDGAAPLVVGVIPFDPAQSAYLYQPMAVSWDDPQQSNGSTTAARGPLLGVATDSPNYRRSVAAAVARIRAAELDKVVLSRRQVVRTVDDPFDPDAVFAGLLARNPTAYTFRVDLPPDWDSLVTAHDAEACGEAAVLLGASPELVVGSRDRRVWSHPLAGTCARGATPALDEAAAEQLLRSGKDLQEHALVARAVADVFRRFATPVQVPAKPSLVPTPVLWHLGTMIEGVLREGVSPLELAYALHPTPAVCGWPREAAKTLIAELEPRERGPFAGLVGWMDATGNADWVLAIRCGIVAGRTAVAFAGAGIVADSVPEEEHAETGLKFATFTDALTTARTLDPAGEAPEVCAPR